VAFAHLALIIIVTSIVVVVVVTACALSSIIFQSSSHLTSITTLDRLRVQLSRRQPLLACRHRGSMQQR
jgi:hypothetical protein